MFRFKSFFVSLIAMVAIAAIGAGAFFSRANKTIYGNFGRPGEARQFIVKSGEGAKSVSERLEKGGLISSAFAFQFYIWRKNLASKIQAGEYEIQTGQNIPKIADILAAGQIKSRDIWITIPEGYNLRQIADKVQSSFQHGGQAKLKVQIELEDIAFNLPQDIREDYWFLKDGKIKTLEGFLFPDTYKFSEDADAEDMVAKMLNNFNSKISPLRSQIEANKMDLREILILASIVEKEVASPEDIKIVAGLFLRRLEIGMLLQSDATINYITQKGDPTPSYKDLESDSPYNTYKYAGLPPGPICNPGVKAIEAVLNPQITDYLYFLTPPGKPTVYSRTNSEHEANKRKWLK